MNQEMGALCARISALEKMLDEREERVTERFTNMKESVAQALASAEKAISKADTATEKRFDSVNEFRQTLSDQAKNFLLASVYEVNARSFSEKLEILATRIGSIESKSEGKSSGISWVGALILGSVIGFSAIGALFLNIFSLTTNHIK